MGTVHRPDDGLPTDGCTLLILIGRAGWQGRNAPVDVRVSLVAAKGENAHTLCAGLLTHIPANVVDQTLQIEEFANAEIR